MPRQHLLHAGESFVLARWDRHQQPAAEIVAWNIHNAQNRTSLSREYLRKCLSTSGERSSIPAKRQPKTERPCNLVLVGSPELCSVRRPTLHDHWLLEDNASCKEGTGTLAIMTQEQSRFSNHGDVIGDATSPTHKNEIVMQRTETLNVADFEHAGSNVVVIDTRSLRVDAGEPTALLIGCVLARARATVTPVVVALGLVLWGKGHARRGV